METINYNLLSCFAFFISLIIILWIMPNKKSGIVIKRIVTLFEALPLSKICNAIIKNIDSKKPLK